MALVVTQRLRVGRLFRVPHEPGGRCPITGSRPVVLAEFRISADSESTILLVVRNAGPSDARDVAMTFLPETL